MELVDRAQERGLVLTGPDGLLKQLTKSVLETALNVPGCGPSANVPCGWNRPRWLAVAARAPSIRSPAPGEIVSNSCPYLRPVRPKWPVCNDGVLE